MTVKLNISKSRAVKILVWLFRIVVGFTFIVSGWAKSIDPWGFIYKIEEYFNVWGWNLPREITLTASIGLSVCEFTVGVLVASGSMRRGAVWFAALFMAFMLPLTAYIAMADPVSDCGCFGDLIVLSNPVTLLKNVVLSAMIVYLLIKNHHVDGVYSPFIQWMVAVPTVAFALGIAFIGYRYQPLVDFRSYKTGSELCSRVDEDWPDDGIEESFIYEKDGERCAFSLDDLPDSTWTFVEASIDPACYQGSMGLSIFDGDQDVTCEVLDGVGDQLLLVVSDPGFHYVTRARLANELSDFVTARGGRMMALVAASGDTLERWVQLALPRYDVYSAEDTSLKELVRGDAALVYIHDGVIVWKRNLLSISHDILRHDHDDGQTIFAQAMAVDDGTLNARLTIIYLSVLVIVYFLNFPPRILNSYLRRRSTKKQTAPC